MDETQKFSGFDVIFLGTSSAQPTKLRSTSSAALKLGTCSTKPEADITIDSKVWLFDVGEGTQRQIQHVGAISPSRIDKIFITHMHGDHCFGLPGIMCAIGAGLSEEVAESHVVDLYGPVGLYRGDPPVTGSSNCAVKYRVHTILQQHETDVHVNEFDVRPNPQGFYDIYDDDQFTVTAQFIQHSVPCLGYVVQEAAKKGALKAAVLKEMGIPAGVLYSQLKAGQTITYNNVTVTPQQVMSPDRPGRKLVVLGDTSDPTSIAPIAMNPDVLIHESTYLDDESSSTKHLAMARGHSTARMAGQFAKLVNAGLLILNHFSPRYCDRELDPTSQAVNCLDDLKQQAQQEFGGRVEVSRDFRRFSLPQRPIPHD